VRQSNPLTRAIMMNGNGHSGESGQSIDNIPSWHHGNLSRNNSSYHQKKPTDHDSFVRS
jgi:hypothetical protein